MALKEGFYSKKCSWINIFCLYHLEPRRNHNDDARHAIGLTILPLRASEREGKKDGYQNLRRRARGGQAAILHSSKDGVLL